MHKPEISLFDVFGQLCLEDAKELVEPSALEEAQLRERQRVIDESICQLTIDEQYVIRRRFGLAGETPVTQEALGREIHKTRQRVQQLEKSGKLKLKVILVNMLGE